MIQTLAELLGDYAVEPGGSPGRQRMDLERHDRRRVIEVRVPMLGLRDLDAGLMNLARLVLEQPDLERATLIAHCPKMTAERLQREWERAVEILRPDVSSRLSLVGLTRDGDVVWPASNSELRHLQALMHQALERRVPTRRASSRVAWAPKSFQVWKTLVDAWLRGEGALPVGEIARRSGASAPTVRGSLALLEERGELYRTSGRGAGIKSLPRRSLSEVIVLADDLRRTRRFSDRSGRRPDPDGLLRRLIGRAPPAVAIGGVYAARHLVPTFDLHGSPRVDVTLPGSISLEWIPAIDPGLAEASPDDPSPVLVVHADERAGPVLQPLPGSRLAFAPPVETLLDLYEMHLTEQAEDFVRLLRKDRSAHGGAA